MLEDNIMQRVVDRSTKLTSIIFLLLSLITACQSEPEVSNPPTETAIATIQPPTKTETPTAISQITEYQLRIEFISSSDWATLNVLNPEHILSVERTSISGNPTNTDAAPSILALNQPLDAAENGESVGMTVDYVIDGSASEQRMDFELKSGAINECSVRIYYLVGGAHQLVHEAAIQGAVDGDHAFSLDFNAIAVAQSESPKPESSVLPSETATIIYHNGIVLTIDDNNQVFEALAVKEDHILAVGNDSDILTYQGPNTIVIDLQGKTLMPGFIDGHSHILREPDRMGRSRQDAIELALSLGLTSVTEMVGETGYIEDLQRAEEEGWLKVRVNVFTNVNKGYLSGTQNIILDDPWYSKNEPILANDLKVRVPGVKIFVDGAGLPQRGCPAMSEPYSAETQAQDWFKAACFGPYGELYWEQADLNEAVLDAQDAGYRVAFHAMGDQAIEVALNAIEYALDGRPNQDVRHQIQHSSVLRPDQLDRYISLDVLSSLRGYFNTCDQDSYENDWAANRYSLPGLGVHAYLEMDFGWTVDPADNFALRNTNPVMQLYGLVTHKQVLEDGTVCDPAPWLAKHVITIEQALRIVTIEPAYAVSQEDHLGSLEPGKFADMIILSENPLAINPDELKDLEVLMTMVGGTTEYCVPGQEVFCP